MNMKNRNPPAITCEYMHSSFRQSKCIYAEGMRNQYKMNQIQGMCEFLENTLKYIRNKNCLNKFSKKLNGKKLT